MRSIALNCKIKKDKTLSNLRKGEGGIMTMVVAAAITTLVLIGFYLVAKSGLTSWGESFKKLVSM